MHNWRLLLLAFLAAIQPIASFTERNLVDGLQECCDRQSHTLLRDSRYGTHRFSKDTTDDNRLDQRETLQEERRYELRKPIHTRHSSDRLLLDTREKNTRQLTRYSRFEKIQAINDRFSSTGNAPQGNVRGTRNDIDPKINRERVTREHGRDSFESYRISRDERRITRLENDRYSRISRDPQRVTRPMQDNTREFRRISSTNDDDKRNELNDGIRTKNINSKHNKRDMAREQYTESRQSLILSELRSQMDDNKQRRSRDRRDRERNKVSRRSLSLESKINRFKNLREDSQENIRDEMRNREIRESRVLIQQVRDNLSRATRNSHRRLSFVQNSDRASSDLSRIVNINGIRETARYSRSRDIDNSRLERDSTYFRHVDNERFANNRQEIRDPKSQSSVRSEGKKIFSSNLRERTDKRRAQESSRVDTELFIRNRQNTRIERWSAGVTEKENNQFYANRQVIMSEDRSHHQNIARIVRKRQDIRSDDKNERFSAIRQGIRMDERSFRLANRKNGDRLTEIRRNFRRDERLSAAVTRAQNEKLSQIRQEFVKYEEILNGQDNTRTIENRQDEVKNMRSSRNRLTKNVVRRSIEASRENRDRPQVRNIERLLPSSNREGDERFSQFRNHERRFLVTNQEELSSDRKVVAYNERFSKKADRMEIEQVFRNRREIRSDERISQDSRENKDRLLNRQDNRKNERYSRLGTRNDRDVRKGTLISKEKQISRSHDSKVDRSRSAYPRENVLTRTQHSTETISRTRNLMDREFVSELRNSEIVRSREIVINLMKMQSEQPIFVVNWHIVLYTLQGIYMCSFIMQMMSEYNTKNTTKSRRLSWMLLPSQNLFKLD